MNKEQARQLIAFSKKFREIASLYSFNAENPLSPHVYGKEISDFIQFFYNNKLISPEYGQIREELFVNKTKPEWYAGLSEQKILECLSYFIRGDRFCDGLLVSGIEDGTISHLIERIKVIYGL